MDEPDAVTEHDAGIAAILHRYWGFDTLRPLQAEASREGLSRRDSLVVLPTGGGKSLCYQVPAALRGRTGIVVSPLISLMKDQVDGLRLSGYPAAALHSGLTIDEARQVEDDALSGALHLLFVAPERLLTGRMLAMLERMGVDSISIDEAHCISQWGHDFRPEYRRLAELRARFPHAAVHGYTATATPRVRDDIIAQLQLRDPEVLVGRFDRPNLRYSILPRLRLVDQVAEVLLAHQGEAAICYCLSRKDTEQLACALTERGIRAEAYHAGLSSGARRRVQDDFAQEHVNVVCATVAFGMGIDRSNVRCVIHAAMPKSVEAYQQETGRAGRDGLPAACVMFYSGADASRWRDLIELSASEAEDPAAAAAPQLELLGHMHRFCRCMRCRHAQLSAYFGQDLDSDNCGACDVCLGEVEDVEDSRVIAQKILSCIARLQQPFGAAHVADVLRGSTARRITERGHDRLSTFGLLRTVRRETLMSYIDQLIDAGVLDRADGEFPVLTLNERSREALMGEAEIRLCAPKGARAPTRAGRAGAPLPAEWTGHERGLFESLRQLRRELAAMRNVPPYIVFGDTALREMVRVRPTTIASMLSVRGVGQRKLDEFGEAFMTRIRTHCQRHDMPTDLAGTHAGA